MFLPAVSDARGGHNRIQVDFVFFKTWTSQMAYVLGFIYADGAIEDVQKSSRTCYLTLTSKDISILNQIKAALHSQHILYKIPAQLLTYPNGKRYLSKKRYTLRIGNKEIYNDLLRLGLTPRKSLTITFPKIPPRYLPYFIRGYFDGDGCIHLKQNKYPLVVFTSGSSNFLDGLNRSLHKFLGIPLKIKTLNNYGPTSYLQLRYGSESSKTILKFIYNNLQAAPFLKRKYLIYKKYLALKTETSSPDKT